MATYEQALDEATAAGSAGFLPRLIERLGGSARAESVFAPPAERDGVTVIPVARVGWGGGGGGGGGTSRKEGKDERGQGSGGGGGVSAKPVGFIRIRDGDAEFVPIRDITAMGPLTVAVAIAAAILLRSLRKLVR